MLIISPELALAFETGTLVRWKVEIVALLRQDHPTDSARFQGETLEDWVREAMDSLRRIGATARDDIAFFVVTLFRVTEVQQDARATGDLAAIMGSSTAYPAKMALLRKAF